MEYKTDAQRRMAEVFDELGIMATYREKDGFFTVQQGGAAAKEFLIHEGAFQDETVLRTLQDKYTCITLSPDGTLTYDEDGSAVLVKFCKGCAGFFLLFFTCMAVVIEHNFNSIPGIVHYAVSKVLVSQKFITLCIDFTSLLVYNIIVIKKMLSDFKVLVFNLSLSLCNTLVEPWMVNRFSRFHTDTAHHILHAVTAKETHKVIVHRNKELASSRVSLSSGTTAELVINSA